MSQFTNSTSTDWAVNSAGECHPHTVEAGGSNPPPPTIVNPISHSQFHKTKILMYYILLVSNYLFSLII
jgi:hypothetical protein